MNRSFVLLRLLVFLGCLPVLEAGFANYSTPRGATRAGLGPDQSGDCFLYVATEYDCPSGCTSSKYYSYVENGGGTDTFQEVPEPCGAAKPGESCAQPYAIKPASNFDNCCVQLGEECDVNTPCCDGTCEYVCCLSEGSPCGDNPGDCCEQEFCNEDNVCEYD